MSNDKGWKAANDNECKDDTTYESDNGLPYNTTESRYKKEIQIYTEYLQDHGRTDRTIFNNEKILTYVLRYLYEHGKNCTANTITGDDVRYYLEARKDLNDNTLMGYLTILDNFVKYFTGRTPFKDLDILWNRRTFKRLFISKSDFEKVLAVAEPRTRMIMIFGAYMGLRGVEMMRMRFQDIHDDTITIHGKGHGNTGFCMEAIIPPKVKEELIRYVNWRRTLKVMDETLDHVLFCYKENGHRIVPMDEKNNGVCRMVIDAGKKAGIKITAHSLRRLYATTLYYDLNVDIITIRDLMRHSKSSTTVDHYIQAYDNRRRDAVSKLNSFMGA